MCSSVDLPEPDGPTIGEQLAGLHVQRHAPQGLDPAGVGLADAFEGEHRHPAVTTRQALA